MARPGRGRPAPIGIASTVSLRRLDGVHWFVTGAVQPSTVADRLAGPRRRRGVARHRDRERAAATRARSSSSCGRRSAVAPTSSPRRSRSPGPPSLEPFSVDLTLRGGVARSRCSWPTTDPGIDGRRAHASPPSRSASAPPRAGRPAGPAPTTGGESGAGFELGSQPLWPFRTLRRGRGLASGRGRRPPAVARRRRARPRRCSPRASSASPRSTRSPRPTCGPTRPGSAWATATRPVGPPVDLGRRPPRAVRPRTPTRRGRWSAPATPASPWTRRGYGTPRLVAGHGRRHGHRRGRVPASCRCASRRPRRRSARPRACPRAARAARGSRPSRGPGASDPALTIVVSTGGHVAGRRACSPSPACPADGARSTGRPGTDAGRACPMRPDRPVRWAHVCHRRPGRPGQGRQPRAGHRLDRGQGRRPARRRRPAGRARRRPAGRQRRATSSASWPPARRPPSSTGSGCRRPASPAWPAGCARWPGSPTRWARCRRGGRGPTACASPRCGCRSASWRSSTRTGPT